MRDKLKDISYFTGIIDQYLSSNNRLVNWLNIGKTSIERINIVKFSILQNYISLILCKFSIGLNKSQISTDLIKAIQWAYEAWDDRWKINDGHNKLDQYDLGSYDLMLWMLSIGYLLNIPENDFLKLVKIIDRDNIKDHLYEFIIRNKIKNRESIKEESYKIFFGIPEVYSKLRQAIFETDKKNAQTLICEFITKDWYSNHKESSWYNSHKDKYNTYLGYWSFETAAIVKILGIDDSSFINCQYYPKDLVHD